MLVDFPNLPGVSRPVALEAKHLQAYLDEFAFRFNRRKSRHVGMIFFRLAQHGVQTTPAPYRALVRPARKHHRLRSHDRSG